MYSVVRIRGKKYAGVFFSNDLSLFYPLTHVLIESTNTESPWKVRFILFYWVSLVFLNPYQFDESESAHIELMNSLTNAAQSCIQNLDPVGEVAAHFLSLLLSRQFYPKALMIAFLESSVETVVGELTDGKEQKAINLFLFVNEFAEYVDNDLFVDCWKYVAPVTDLLTSDSVQISFRLHILMLKLFFRICSKCVNLSYTSNGIDAMLFNMFLIIHRTKMYVREKDVELMQKWRECMCNEETQDIISKACEVLMNDCLNDVCIQILS